MGTGFWWESVNDRGRLEDIGIDWRIILKDCLKEIQYEVTDLAEIINPLNPELHPICYLLALLAHHFLHVSRIRVKSLTIRLLMSYIYGAPILDVSRSQRRSTVGRTPLDE